MSTKLVSAVAMASAFMFAACSAQRPVLYPNAHLKRVGSSAAEFRPFVANAIRRMGEIVRIAGVEPQ